MIKAKEYVSKFDKLISNHFMKSNSINEFDTKHERFIKNIQKDSIEYIGLL